MDNKIPLHGHGYEALVLFRKRRNEFAQLALDSELAALAIIVQLGPPL
jgi:hypothetical protein